MRLLFLSISFFSLSHTHSPPFPYLLFLLLFLFFLSYFSSSTSLSSPQELEQIEETWRGESQELLKLVESLQEENRRLTARLNESGVELEASEAPGGQSKAPGEDRLACECWRMPCGLHLTPHSSLQLHFESLRCWLIINETQHCTGVIKTKRCVRVMELHK